MKTIAIAKLFRFTDWIPSRIGNQVNIIEEQNIKKCPQVVANSH